MEAIIGRERKREREREKGRVNEWWRNIDMIL